ncbi:MAG: gliding motility-associated C-terminal domain-containing protein [Bacteroidales bacterium]|nr:gliding motility-associated C-terminal domain-containing protein [Bacteroidales bacterium]
MFAVFSVSVQARNERDTLALGQRMHFVKNCGQWNENILYESQIHAGAIFLERTCFTVNLQHRDNDNLHHADAAHVKSGKYRTHAYRVHFEGASPQSVAGGMQEDTYSNYFIGNDRSRWASKVPQFLEVTYSELYHGIDLKVYSAENAMKYDFIVQPNADPRQIAMRYEGADAIRLQEGNIIVRTSVADIVELRPYAYQMVNGREVEVDVDYKLDGDRITFKTGSYNHSLPLVIDPYLIFSTYTGSTADNWGTTACSDFYKNTYSSGVVFNTGYPVSLGAYDSQFHGQRNDHRDGVCDIGIFKFDTSGSRRLFATYLGGMHADMPHSLYVNEFNELILFGTTGSPDFPVSPTAYDTSFNGGRNIYYESQNIAFPLGVDIFVCRFSTDGARLEASTFIGGSGNDGINYKSYYNRDNDIVMLGNDSLYFNYGDGARGELITDDLNNIYVGSTTFSSDFPITPGSCGPTYGGGQDGIVLKFDYNLSNLLWSCYLGGSGDDVVNSIDTDTAYNVVVTGGTTSRDFPTTATAYSGSYNGGSADAFVSKISYHGNHLMSSTYFGSPAYDQSYFVRIGKKDDIFLFGQTKASGSSLVRNAIYNVPNSGQFLVRFTPNLNRVVWSTVFGTGSGTPNISPTAFAVDICNRIYVAGWGLQWGGYYLGGQRVPWNAAGTHNMTVTRDAYQRNTDGMDFYIMSMTEDASRLEFATYFGELHGQHSGGGHDHVDGGTSRFDRMATICQAVCASCGGYDQFPVSAGSWSTSNNSSNCNNAVFRYNVSGDFPVADFITPSMGCAPDTIAFRNTGRGDSFKWFFGDGATSTDTNPTHIYTSPGTYTVTLIASMPGGCRAADTLKRTFKVLGSGRYMLDTVATCPGAPTQIGVSPLLGGSYRWIRGTVSDNTVPNPYVNQAGVYELVITNGNCHDTATQVVVWDKVEVDILGDTATCQLPVAFIASSASNDLRYYWSNYRNIGDTINRDPSNPQIMVYPRHPQYYYVLVEDSRGCTGLDSVHISFLNILDSIEVVNPLCYGNCTGQVLIHPNGGAHHPITYTLNSRHQVERTVFANLCDGSYHLVMRDSAGCEVQRDVMITSAPRTTVTKQVVHVSCYEQCTGSIDLAIQGDGACTCRWLDDGSTLPTRTNLCPGTYIVEITNSVGCVVFDTTDVFDNANLTVEASLLSPTCPELCNGAAMATVAGGEPPYTYLWSSGESGSTANNLCGGPAVVTVVDNTGCTVRSQPVFVDTMHSFDNFRAWADTTLLFIGESTRLHATPVHGAAYAWYPTGSLDNYTSREPLATPDDTTCYIVTVTDTHGCHIADTVCIDCIYVDCGRDNIRIPNAFTPNGDGYNDKLCFMGDWIEEFYIAIFTRWGEKVYESDNVSSCWDGTYKGQPCMQGVYTFLCRVRCKADKRSEFKGDITLIR